MAKNVVVIGAQWGDEGKGKIVDWLAEETSGVVQVLSFLLKHCWVKSTN